MVETVSFRSATDQGITETLQHSELESGAGRGEQRCGFGVGDIVNKEGGEQNKREIKFKKSWKRRHSKLYRYTIHR